MKNEGRQISADLITVPLTSKLFLPVAGNSAFEFFGILVAGALPYAWSTVSVIGHADAIAPLRTVRTTVNPPIPLCHMTHRHHSYLHLPFR